MGERNIEAETRFIWKWAANRSRLRLPDILPDMAWDADDTALIGADGDVTIRFHVELEVRGRMRTQIAVIRLADAGWEAREEYPVPEVVTQAAKKAGAGA